MTKNRFLVLSLFALCLASSHLGLSANTELSTPQTKEEKGTFYNNTLRQQFDNNIIKITFYLFFYSFVTVNFFGLIESFFGKYEKLLENVKVLHLLGFTLFSYVLHGFFAGLASVILASIYRYDRYALAERSYYFFRLLLCVGYGMVTWLLLCATFLFSKPLAIPILREAKSEILFFGPFVFILGLYFILWRFFPLPEKNTYTKEANTSEQKST